MTRQQANLEILNILGKYLMDNPDIRFGQALRNTGIVFDRLLQKPELDIFEVIWVNGFNEEPEVTLERVKERETK